MRTRTWVLQLEECWVVELALGGRRPVTASLLALPFRHFLQLLLGFLSLFLKLLLFFLDLLLARLGLLDDLLCRRKGFLSWSELALDC